MVSEAIEVPGIVKVDDLLYVFLAFCPVVLRKATVARHCGMLK